MSYIVNKIITKQKYKDELENADEYVISEIHNTLYKTSVGNKIRIANNNESLLVEVVDVYDFICHYGEYISRYIEVDVLKVIVK